MKSNDFHLSILKSIDYKSPIKSDDKGFVFWAKVAYRMNRWTDFSSRKSSGRYMDFSEHFDGWNEILTSDNFYDYHPLCLFKEPMDTLFYKESFFYKHFGSNEFFIDHKKQELPSKQGIYIVSFSGDEITTYKPDDYFYYFPTVPLYIGKTETSFCERWQNHHVKQKISNLFFPNKVSGVYVDLWYSNDFLEIKNIDALEKKLIWLLRPELNQVTPNHHDKIIYDDIDLRFFWDMLFSYIEWQVDDNSDYFAKTRIDRDRAKGIFRDKNTQVINVPDWAK